MDSTRDSSPAVVKLDVEQRSSCEHQSGVVSAPTAQKEGFTRRAYLAHLGKHRLHRALAVAIFWLLPRLVDQSGTDFPASLICMLALSGLLLLLEICGKSSWAEQTFLFLQPGQQFLVKWSALFFLPSMVELPVVLGEGFSAWVIGRMLIYIVIGWLIHITLLVTISSLLHRAKRAFTETSKPEASNLEKHDVESSGSLSCAAEHDPAPKADQSPADMSDVSVQQCTPVPIVSNDDDGRARLEPPTWPFNASLLVFLAVLFIIGFSMAPSKTG
jgi:hypothetical protein